MRLSLFIAWRYLFSKKKQNAINIISAISVVGVTVGTTALIVVLSVFNGMDMLLQESTDSFTPDLVVFPAEGKYAVFDSAFCNRLEASPDIASCHQVIEEKALARYGDYTTPVVVKGVDGAYLEDSGFAAHILDGVPVLKSSDGYEALLGYGVAAQLRLSLSSLRPLVCYYPDKNAAPTVAALNTRPIYPAAFFSVQQEIDDHRDDHALALADHAAHTLTHGEHGHVHTQGEQTHSNHQQHGKQHNSGAGHTHIQEARIQKNRRARNGIPKVQHPDGIGSEQIEHIRIKLSQHLASCRTRAAAFRTIQP